MLIDEDGPTWATDLVLPTNDADRVGATNASALENKRAAATARMGEQRIMM